MVVRFWSRRSEWRRDAFRKLCRSLRRKGKSCELLWEGSLSWSLKRTILESRCWSQTAFMMEVNRSSLRSSLTTPEASRENEEELFETRAIAGSTCRSLLETSILSCLTTPWTLWTMLKAKIRTLISTETSFYASPSQSTTSANSYERKTPRETKRTLSCFMRLQSRASW